MHFSRIHLRNWKNFNQIEAPLQSRVFIIGPNASGKSNLLDAFRFLQDVAVDGLRKATEESRSGVSTIRSLSAKRYSDIVIEVDVVGDGGVKWTYRLIFNQNNQRRTEIKEEHVTKNDEVLLNRPDKEDRDDPARLTQTALEQIYANQRFRELAEFFASISYQHLLPQVLRDPRGFSSVPTTNDPYGRDFLLRLWQTNTKTRDARLKKISAALRIAVPNLTDLKATMDDTGVAHLEGGYAHWRPDAARQNESQFSDGTLRLLGLLWTAFEGYGPLLLEEPEISLHPEIVRRLPSIFQRISRERKESKRQIIISTHSEALLSDGGIGAEEVLRIMAGPEGSFFQPADQSELQALKAGLTIADVIIPATTPKDVAQMRLEF
ncbi:MAG: AAA family ATPase [Caldilineales bacterium]